MDTNPHEALLMSAMREIDLEGCSPERVFEAAIAVSGKYGGIWELDYPTLVSVAVYFSKTD